jgi:hypothetical protein
MGSPAKQEIAELDAVDQTRAAAEKHERAVQFF